MISLPLGVWAALNRERWPDFIVRGIAFTGVSLPNFWLGFLLILLFSVGLEWLPPLGRGGIEHLVMPAIAVSLMSLAINARLIRTSMLEVAGQRHVLYARLRGLPESRVVGQHVFYNALLPVITAVGMHIGELIGGTLVVENIFGWPGLGAVCSRGDLQSGLSGSSVFHPVDDDHLRLLQPDRRHPVRVARSAHPDDRLGACRMSQTTNASSVAARIREDWLPSPSVALSAAIIATLVVVSVAAPLIAPYDPNAVDLSQRLQGVSIHHLAGTDHLGRDILSRLIYGARLSLSAVAIVLSIILVLGIGVGSIAGYAGGRIDNAIMRFCDIFLTFPTFVLAMFMVGVLGTGIVNVILAISLSHWAWYARIARGLVLSLKERDYVLAARVAGGTRFGVFLTHILPSVLVQFVVLCTLDIGHMILHVAGLSFLGLGVMPPTPEWGVMINDAREFIWTQPMLMAWPGLMIFGTVMAFNQLGDALRDRLDPTLRMEIV